MTANIWKPEKGVGFFVVSWASDSSIYFLPPLAFHVDLMLINLIVLPFHFCSWGSDTLFWPSWTIVTHMVQKQSCVSTHTHTFFFHSSQCLNNELVFFKTFTICCLPPFHIFSHTPYTPPSKEKCMEMSKLGRYKWHGVISDIYSCD